MPLRSSSRTTTDGTDRASHDSPIDDWLLQDAVKEAPSPSVQAAFCIAVRSEVVRRALEGQDETVRTLAFGGFFGLPVDDQPLGSASARPQLTGLLAPVLRVTEDGAPIDLAARRQDRLRVDAAHRSPAACGPG